MIPLAEVKNHLRIENDFTEDDDALTRMVNAAIGYIEKHTGHIFGEQTKTYSCNSNGYIDIYEYPLSYAGGLTKFDFITKSRFYSDSVTLTVGYKELEDVPSALIQAALMMGDAWYYTDEKNLDQTNVPAGAWQLIHTYRRYV